MKFISKHADILAVLIFMSFVVQACGNNEEIILTNPCSPPCWRYIIPGETNHNELIRLLEEMSDVKQKSIKNLGSWNIFDDSTTVQLDSNSIVEFYFIDDKVTLIALHGKYDMTYSEAVENFGTPDVITAARSMGPGNLGIGDSPLLYISSMIPEKGLGFGFNSRNLLINSAEEINPDSKITNFDYYAPKFFQTLLNSGLFTMGDTRDIRFLRSNYK